MLSTDALQAGFLSSLTIVSETTIFIKTIVLKTTVSFLILHRRFHNETIVFQKNENVKSLITVPIIFNVEIISIIKTILFKTTKITSEN